MVAVALVAVELLSVAWLLVVEPVDEIVATCNRCICQESIVCLELLELEATASESPIFMRCSVCIVLPQLFGSQALATIFMQRNHYLIVCHRAFKICNLLFLQHFCATLIELLLYLVFLDDTLLFVF